MGNETSPQANSGKGRPTPKRREAEKRNLRPLVPADRKEAKRKAREAARLRRDQAFERQNEAMRTGDERYLPLRDKGQVRRLARNLTDARYTSSELLLPALITLLIASIVLSNYHYVTLATAAMIVTYVLISLAVAESVFIFIKLRRLVKERYPNAEFPRWTGMYIFSRLIMVRRWRQPMPQVDRSTKI